MWADAAYAGGFQRWARDERGWHVEIAHHPDRQLRRYGLTDDARRAFRVSPRGYGRIWWLRWEAAYPR
ncbi:MAG TPA: hypothetical protein VFY87_15200 [Geminicoccaceae bacterium]|nr:hypothetical protein [Geminicoccaceae bacterium]